MIPLRLKAEFEGGVQEPFVVVLHDASAANDTPLPDELFEPHRAKLISTQDRQLVFRTEEGTLRIDHPQFGDIAGDVLLVVPERHLAHRLIRSQSSHNTLVVTEQCDQLCVMCSQPPKNEHVDLFDQFLIAAQLAPRDAMIGLSGGEPTLHKASLFEFLVRVHETRPDLRFHVLTNAQHFTDADVPVLQQPGLRSVCWGVPIYSATPGQHDGIVQKPGAFATLLHSLGILMQAGSYLELRTVIMRQNEPDLPDLASFVATHLSFSTVWAIMQLENIGFARKAWNDIFFDNSLDFSRVAVAINEATARGVKVELFNFPLCTIPCEYRAYSVRSISDWKQRYLEECSTCTLRQSCAGFFEWYPEDRGFARIQPL